MSITRISLTHKLPLSRSSSLALLLCIAFAFLAYALMKGHLLPPRFFYDANTIDWYISEIPRFEIGNSYSSTAAFFSIFAIDQDSLLLPIGSGILITISLHQALANSKLDRLQLGEFLLLLAVWFLMSTYLTMLSKDIIVFLLMMVFPMGSTGYKKLITWTLLAALYALYFRAYWFIIIGFFWAFLLLMRIGRKKLLLYATPPALLLILSLCFQIFLDVDIDHYRNLVNENRIDNLEQDARTMITPLIPGSGTVVSWINTVITWALLMFPLPLLLLLSPYYLLNMALISYLFYKALRSARYLYIHKPDHDLRITATCSLILAFTAVQSIFEPDYGSFVKHLTPLYPSFIYLIARARTIKIQRLAQQ